MFQWLTGLVGWMASPITSLPAQRRQRVLFWLVQVVVVVVVVTLLTLLNNLAGIDQMLRTRWLGLNRVWLPLLFLVGYALFWLIVWLWGLLGPAREAGEFTDIEESWKAALKHLEAAGVNVREVPVFLVLGRSSGSMEDFFAATRVPFQVRHAPKDGPPAPLHVYANRDAVFVTCEGACLLGVQAERLLSRRPPVEVPEAQAMLDAPQLPSSDLAGLLPPVAALPPPPGLPGLPPVPAVPQMPVDLSPLSPLVPGLSPDAPGIDPAAQEAEPSRGGAVLLLGEPEPAPGEAEPIKRLPPLIRDEEAVDLQTRRLGHVCRLLVRDRQPYCPANGVLVLLPMAATDSPEDASETAAVVQQDLEVAREALQLDCPRFAVLCGAEQLPGFAEVVRAFPDRPGEATWLLGSHFPLLPDVPASEVPELIEGSLGWVADTMLPVVVGRLWRREGEEAGGGNQERLIDENMRLYGFLREGRDRVHRLARLVARGMLLEGTAGMPYYGGTYVAGTGADGEREQAFLAGVIRRALDCQNAVRWTASALGEDAMYARYALVAYGLLVVFVAAVAAMLWGW